MIQLNFPNPVIDEKDFFGRERKSHLDRIEQQFRSGRPTSIVIIGERRIGKTSQLNVLLQRLVKLAEQDLVPLTIEPRGITTFDDLAKAILQRLASLVSKSLPIDAETKDSFQVNTLEQFEGIFASLIDPDFAGKYILCIDEFDEIIRNTDSELSKIIGLTNSVIEAKTNLPLLLLFSMTRLPKSLEKDKSSPLLSRTELLRLQSFSKADIEEMVGKLLAEQVVLVEEQLDWLYQISGGHPYFVKLLLDVLLRQSYSEAITQEVLDQILRDAVNDPRARIAVENLYRIQFDDNEKRIALLFTAIGRSIAVDELLKAGTSFLTAAKSLVRRDYLCEQENQFDFKIGFLRHWLRNWIEFEEELERRRVERILNPFHGSQPTIVTDDDLWRNGLLDQ